MAIAIAATKSILSDAYKGAGTWLGLATGNPGTSATPSNEATGGGYARKQTTWGASASGVTTGSAQTIDCAAATYSWIILASASTVAAANMIDNSDITDVVMSATGQIVVTPTFTQT